MRAYPIELRERIVRAVAAGTPRAEVARLFAVSPRTSKRYLAQDRQRGDLTPGQSPGRPARLGPQQADTLRRQVAAFPDATLAEPCDRWADEQGVRVSVATMSRTLRRLQSTVNNSPARQ